MFMLGGQNFYGKIDRVPGLFYVATQFIHLFYIPLIPMGTHLVVEDQNDMALRRDAPLRYRTAKSIDFLVGGNSFRSAKLGFNLRSLLYAWANIALIIIILRDGYYLWEMWEYPSLTEGREAWPTIGQILACLAALWVIRWSSYASERRAVELGRRLGFDDATVLNHVHSGR
ncbi:hypothetical protein [Hyphomicrobium sp.]|uniref:hypothetical protein n=1 Tax=Hyphomicrobium sp. TaxID=82 RepID=UPI0025B848A1|nr:hypothetical protein [Hyphomicrobium sp.]MCC7252612.1 hypothetical protein [Hyphomicrobium sp.]